MKELEIFYAVNKSGQAKVFTTYPARDEHRNIWIGDINVAVISFVDCIETVYGFKLPEISWKDEPVTITIRIGYD